MVNGKVDPSADLDQVQFAFDRWRRQRGGKGRIPERLWVSFLQACVTSS